ncbi:kinase D-interacting substrate of 220 kDa B isoform X4 [Microplitis mediator]|uniref:kinase D-interacting substrate of 220 kDa B isoform X4 n=1 Tax=Microplitis mediator TaxID=375433 RepID=UPI0025577825|nr:kinase D-interacting substrate of 220 kDa B isoform X4 [Microplitis mediator]
MSHLIKKKNRSSNVKIYRQVSLQPDYRKNQFFFFKERSHDTAHRLHETLHRSDSMVSLCYRPLATYITEDNLIALRNFLENKRVPIDDRDENGSTALILSASKGKIQFVRELINHGADVNAEDADNWTALLCAAKEGHTDVCLELLEHGADLEHRDLGGWTALMWASYKGHTSTVTLLLTRGADVNAHGNYHISSLLWAAGRGHTEIVKELIVNGAKVNVGDKYGTTALIWAARKGSLEIVDTLLRAGANVDTAGMYSWTALIVAAIGNYVDVITLLLEYKPNVNALDKDGYTALAIASREGYHEIVSALLNAGAYINIQDRAGDTNLIHAVKNGHRNVVDALLKKHVDVNIAGKDRKTATYIAVEKGNISILKLLLQANPDLEIATKDGDTPLLRAVRSRNGDIVQLLLDKNAKVHATDNKGDTVLHIAMRARSKAIVEILLRNPKNSQLLYRPNRQGETPYNIDLKHPKTILGQVFGARRLNTNEDNENMLGYDLYSSALADILSEPSLSTPITVGLYAKWGSGKSFLLNKLREEMKNFAKQWIDPAFQFSTLLLIVTIHVSVLVGVTVGLALMSWIIGIIVGVSTLTLVYTVLGLTWYSNNHYDWRWPYKFNVGLTTKLNSLRLLLQVIFCHPPGSQTNDGLTIQPIKFYFTDQTRVGTTAAGENAVVQMVGSLYDSIENDFGSLVTRLYRAFRPKPVKSTSNWRWRHLCCLPYIVIFEFCFFSLVVGVSVVTIYFVDSYNNIETIKPFTAHIIMITVALLLAFNVIANLYTWSRTFRALIFSQRRHLQRSIAKLDTLKSEGFIQTLKYEVTLMIEMVKCLDSFTAQQSRLVLIVDGLDSCEQDKVLLVLDAMQALFLDNGCPFIIILAIDPHIISKAVEVNSRRLFTESNIGGHDYLRNMVHVPFYLQNSGLRKVKIAQQTAQLYKKGTWYETEESVNYATTSSIHHPVSNRRLSTESSVMNSNEKLKPPSRKGSRKMRLSESIASSIGSNLNRLGGAQDLNKMLLTDDYFSDVNPRSMRRLMNVVYVTGRLLKAFQIDFNWYHLASWINITEQWPFRTSWIIHHYDKGDECDDTTPLKVVYDKVRPQIPTLKEVQPLLEIDRDERKLDAFLGVHRNDLLVSDMKIFLPFTINLDPYIKKKIKEEQQSMEDDGSMAMYKNPWQKSVIEPPWGNRTNLSNRHAKLTKTPSLQGSVYPPPAPIIPWQVPTMAYDWTQTPWMSMPPVELINKSLSATTTLPTDILELKLSSLSVNSVCDLLSKVDELNPNNIESYKNIVRENNITGKVLLHCDLAELKEVLKMTFGDWELFRMVIVSLREQERTSFTTCEEGPRSVRFTVQPEINRKDVRETQVNNPRVLTHVDKEKSISRTDGPPRRDSTKHSIMEKQVTLEEQMICGALQTLNEEACEDVLNVPSPSVVPPPDSLPGGRARSVSVTTAPDTDYVLLQPSPIYHWVPVPDEPESSDDSSQGSTTQLHRSSSQRSVTSQRSTRSTYSYNNRVKKKPPTSTAARPTSLRISPTASPRPAYRSKSTDEYPTKNEVPAKQIPSSALLGNNLRHSTPTITDEIKIIVPTVPTNLDKLTKLKDRLIGTSSSPSLHACESDDESTPLVSELSTPSHTQSDSVFTHALSPESDQSPLSMKSLPQTGEHAIDIQYCDSMSLVIHESADARSLSRQNAEEWDSPETPV